VIVWSALVKPVGNAEAVGTAQVASPRQNVDALALVPLFRFATPKFPVIPVVNGRPVQLVKTPDVGVPSIGVTNVGDVEKTRFVEVVPVVPAAETPKMALRAAIPAAANPVPPFATGKTPVIFAVISIVPFAIFPFVIVLSVISAATIPVIVALLIALLSFVCVTFVSPDVNAYPVVMVAID
jgi:hypothetical protein